MKNAIDELKDCLFKIRSNESSYDFIEGYKSAIEDLEQAGELNIQSSLLESSEAILKMRTLERDNLQIMNKKLIHEIQQLIENAEQDNLTYSVLENARKLIFQTQNETSTNI